MRALILDDSPALREEIGRILTEAGFQVLACENGGDALGLLEEKGVVDLVLVDWDLPEAGGLRFLLEFRSILRPRPARLIMLTERPSTADILEAIHLGVDECLVKPFGPRRLLEKLESLGLGAD